MEGIVMDKKMQDDAAADTPAGLTSRGAEARRIAILVIGDIIIFLIFAAIGRRSHGEAAGLNALLPIVLTAAPFAAGWFIISPFVGAFRRELADQPRKMAWRTLLSWVASWPLAMILRGAFVDHGVPPATFATITLVTNTILLLLWRVPYAWLRGFNASRKREQPADR
jgi:hypothetical protein